MGEPQTAMIADSRRARLAAGRDVRDVLVLVAGTVDPVNLDPVLRANSYPGIPDTSSWYWFENPALREKLEELEIQHRSLQLFDFHGWTGDNSPVNRRVAGHYLADRLVEFYEGFKSDVVHFHFIGHSHGGNVINELTRRAAVAGKWPRRWKIRSVTYLSTPFFGRLHPVHTGKFHRDATVLNVTNEFDIVQRVIADFSMYHLAGVLSAGPIAPLMEHVKKLSFDSSVLDDLDVDVNWDWFDTEVRLSPASGRALYDECIQALEHVSKTFDLAQEVIGALAEPMTFKVGKDLEGEAIVEQRTIIEDGVAQRLSVEIETVRETLDPTLDALRARNRAGVYPIRGFFDDIHLDECIAAIVRFFHLDPDSLSGVVWDLVHDILVTQIHEFDDTTQSPEEQLAGTPFAERIVPIDVTSADDFSNHPEQVAVFRKFIARLEGIEKSYEHGHRRYDLMDLVFVLMAQEPPVVDAARQAEEAARGMRGALDWMGKYSRFVHDLLPRLEEILQVLEGFAQVISTRYAGEMQVSAPDSQYAPGSLKYFSFVSHSVSRFDLGERVLEALGAQLGPKRSKRVQERMRAEK